MPLRTTAALCLSLAMIGCQAETGETIVRTGDPPDGGAVASAKAGITAGLMRVRPKHRR